MRSRSNTPLRSRRSRRPAGPLAAWVVALLVGLTVATVPGVAVGGEWAQVSCVNPDSSPAGSEGWMSMIAGGGYGSNTSTSCGPGLSMFAVLSSDVPVAVGSSETLRYMPPPGSVLNGAQLNVGMFADGFGYGASGTAVAYSPQFAYDGSDVIFQCASGLAPCSAGGPDWSGVLNVPAGRGGGLYLSAGCGGTPGQSCDTNASRGAWSLVELASAVLRLRSVGTPAAGRLSGTLLEPGAHGVAELVLPAGETTGPGIYRVTVQADETTLFDGVPDTNDGRCVAQGMNAGALMFDSAQPCPLALTADLRIDTTGLTDGSHTLRVSVTDAAGNTAVVYDGMFSTHNAPVVSEPPTVSEEGAPLPGGTLFAAPGSWSAPAGAGAVSYREQWQRCTADLADCTYIPGAVGGTYTLTAADVGARVRVAVSAGDRDGSATAVSDAGATVLPAAAVPVANGVGASRLARLRLTGPSVIRRGYTRRGVTVAGQLVDGDGRPISDATLEISQSSAAGPAATAAVQFVGTGADGTFTARVAAGPSRQIDVGYRAFSTDAGFAANATVSETVSAGVRLTVTPRRTTPAGRVLLTGRVAGPVPSAGVVVELLVHYRGRWEPFRDAHTARDGTFTVGYRFQGAVGRFPFRARILGSQAGFPYAPGVSVPVEVVTG